jgi:molybdopterin-binding protein
MNHLRVNVIHVDHDGWVELKLSKGDHDAQLWIESRTITTTGGELQLQLSPDDIVLAREACFETSMRNKIKGIIQTITEHEQCCLVVVDIGQPLICSISKNAKLTMQLCEGDAIFCHFKSQSIHLLN